MPARPVTWIEKGVLKTLSYDRLWAKRQKTDATADDHQQSLVMEGSDSRSSR